MKKSGKILFQHSQSSEMHLDPQLLKPVDELSYARDKKIRRLVVRRLTKAWTQRTQTGKFSVDVYISRKKKKTYQNVFRCECQWFISITLQHS